MLPVQPPAEFGEIKIQEWWAEFGNGKQRTGKIRTKFYHLQTCIRMGLLYDITISKLEEKYEDGGQALRADISYLLRWNTVPFKNEGDLGSADEESNPGGNAEEQSPDGDADENPQDGDSELKNTLIS
jgi:hypothetical protein